MAYTAVDDPLQTDTFTNSEGERLYVNRTTFDSDAAQVGIDNRASDASPIALMILWAL